MTWVRSDCSGAGFDLVLRFGILNSVSLWQLPSGSPVWSMPPGTKMLEGCRKRQNPCLPIAT